MDFEIIPAIDLMGGKPVRLSQGTEESAKAYERKPDEIAKWLFELGYKRLHVVDLDAAFGKQTNIATISGICKSCKIKTQVGGGIRSIERAKDLLGLGATRIIIGTAALDPKFLADIAGKFKQKVWVACDVSEGLVATRGWTQKSAVGLDEFIRYASEFGIGGIVVSDISRDGTLEGIDTKLFSKVAGMTKLPVIASGGVSGIEDIKRAAGCGVSGLIIGKAMYEGKIDMEEAIKIAKSMQ